MRNIAIMAALAAVICSCDLAGLETPDDGMVTFSLHVEPGETVKSSYAGDESTVNDYNVFIYLSGEMYDYGYWMSGDDPLSFTLPVDSYEFYVLCNTGEEMGYYSLGSSPDSYRYSVDSATSMLSGGIPMAGKQTVSVMEGDDAVTLDVTRLVAKYNLYVQRNFEGTKSTFTVTGVKVCQAAKNILPFSSNSTPTVVLSGTYGDYASASDLSCLNDDVTYSGTTDAVSFYMLENAQGTLLPGNTDPWKKCYDEYGGLLSSSDAANCTYLDVTGIWASPGVSETVTYRMFLGTDNCTNFDVLRNEENDVTLELSDTGKERESWKVEIVTYSDTRSLKWSENSKSILSNGKTYIITLSVNPSDIDYKVYYASNPYSPSWVELPRYFTYSDMTKQLELTYVPSTNSLQMKATRSSSLTYPFPINVKAQTPDGVLSTYCNVRVEKGELVSISYTPPYDDVFSGDTLTINKVNATWSDGSVTDDYTNFSITVQNGSYARSTVNGKTITFFSYYTGYTKVTITSNEKNITTSFNVNISNH